MTGNISQDKNLRRPKGPLREIALLRWAPADFEKNRGLRFAAGADDLDEYDWAPLKTGTDHFVLLRYRRSPETGTELLAPMEADPREAVERFLAAAELPRSEVVWETDAVPEPAAVIVEPANPLDIPRPVLADLLERLHSVLPLPPRLALRHEIGFGVTGWQAVRLWLPESTSGDTLNELATITVDWLHDLWKQDAADNGTAARTRLLTVYDSNDQPVLQLMVGGRDGTVLAREGPEIDEHQIPRPTVTDPWH